MLNTNPSSMKMIRRLTSVALIIGLLVFLSGFSSQKKNSAAVINSTAICGIPDFDTGMVYYGKLHSVTNQGGSSILICKSKDALGMGEKREWRNFLCGTYLGPTMDSYLVISSEGNANMRCKVKMPKK